MFILSGPDTTDSHLIVSATDIVTASACEYAAVRSLDVRLGRVMAPVSDPDPMALRVAELGMEHERSVLRQYRNQFGAGVVEIPEPVSMDRRTLTEHFGMTLAALRAGADVVYQASFFDGSFHGRADFLVRQEDGSYAVYDTKLARSVKSEALVQLAAYADQLMAAGIKVSPQAHLILGSGEETTHDLSDLLPGYRKSRLKLMTSLQAQQEADDAATWDAGAWQACMKKDCAHCAEAILITGDLLIVRGMTKAARAQLTAMGITSYRDLLTASIPADDERLTELQEQARMQAGTATVDGSRGGVSYQVKAGHQLHSIPDPETGDIFFDFEGDPIYRDPATGGGGLEYLFGLIEESGDGTRYTGFTAHDFDMEKQALIDFTAYVMDRLEENPDLRIYHFAAYEATALKKLAARHGVLAGEIAFIVENVLFDLLPVVRKSIRLSDTSMSIKKLEPLYMDDVRDGVTNGAASVAEYGAYAAAVQAGDIEMAKAIFESIRAYNEYDCLSTLRLRDWLLSLKG